MQILPGWFLADAIVGDNLLRMVGQDISLFINILYKINEKISQVFFPASQQNKFSALNVGHSRGQLLFFYVSDLDDGGRDILWLLSQRAARQIVNNLTTFWLTVRNCISICRFCYERQPFIGGCFFFSFLSCGGLVRNENSFCWFYR